MEKDGVDEATMQQMEPSAAHADDQATTAAVDLLSGLCDDVLVHILGLTKHAKDIVLTGALSRRWRGLWRRAPALHFDSWRWFKHGGSAEGFMAFIDDTLALHHVRSSDGGDGLEQLVIINMWSACRYNQKLVTPSIGAAERWILYAVRHGVKSFLFQVSLPSNNSVKVHEDDEDGDGDEDVKTTPVLALTELPKADVVTPVSHDHPERTAWMRPRFGRPCSPITDINAIKLVGSHAGRSNSTMVKERWLLP
ncbi:unnamed protein product [Urochloa humidicola]